jgi:hypothetical protein
MNIGQPQLYERSQADGLHNLVDEPTGLEKQQENDGSRRLGQDVGGKGDQP